MTFAFDRGVVAATAYDSDGFLTAQVDGYSDGSPNPGAPFGEMQQLYGEYGRPCDPDLDADGVPKPSSACQALFWWDGPRLHVQPMQDPRIIPNLPMLSPGSRVWYAAGAASKYKPTFLHFDAATGDAVLYVPYLDGSKAHVISLSASGDNITVRHASGAGLSLTSTDAILNAPDGGAYAQLSNGGALTLNGNVQAVGGLTAGGPAAMPLAHAAPVVTSFANVAPALTSIGLAMTALATYLTANSATTTGTGPAATAASAAATAASQAAVAIALLESLIPTTTVSGV